MRIISYLSNLAIPLIILLVLFFGIKEKKSIFDLFIEGAKEGIIISCKIFPTLIGIFFAIEVFKNSGLLNFIINRINIITSVVGFPKEILPLAIIKPISGSASIAVGTEIMKKHGVDSMLGLISSTIMGSTETTFYTIAIYTSCIKVKKTGLIIWPALIGDVVGITLSVVFWRILS